MKYSTNVSSYGTVADGLTDDSSAFQQAIDHMADDYSGGHVLVPPGNYCFHNGITIKKSVQLIGSGIGCTLLQSKKFNVNTVTFDATCFQAAIEKMLICGYEGPDPQTNCITVARNVPVIIRDVYAWQGWSGLFTQGVDGLVENCFIAGQKCGITSNGANWYLRSKFDSLGNGQPTDCGFLHGSIFPGEVMENHFTQCDFSGDYSHAVSIYDGTPAAEAITVFDGCIMDRPISIGFSHWTSINHCEISSTISAGGPTSIIGCYSFSPISVPGATKAGNINIT